MVRCLGHPKRHALSTYVPRLNLRAAPSADAWLSSLTCFNQLASDLNSKRMTCFGDVSPLLLYPIGQAKLCHARACHLQGFSTLVKAFKESKPSYWTISSPMRSTGHTAQALKQFISWCPFMSTLLILQTDLFYQQIHNLPHVFTSVFFFFFLDVRELPSPISPARRYA